MQHNDLELENAEVLAKDTIKMLDTDGDGKISMEEFFL